MALNQAAVVQLPSIPDQCRLTTCVGRGTWAHDYEKELSCSTILITRSFSGCISVHVRIQLPCHRQVIHPDCCLHRPVSLQMRSFSWELSQDLQCQNTTLNSLLLLPSLQIRRHFHIRTLDRAKSLITISSSMRLTIPRKSHLHRQGFPPRACFASPRLFSLPLHTSTTKHRDHVKGDTVSVYALFCFCFIDGRPFLASVAAAVISAILNASMMCKI